MPQHEQLDEEVDDSWIDEYNAAMMRKPQGAPQLPEVGCYPVCCTFFSTFGAVFLFAVAGLMRGGYKYLHIPGDNEILATPVAYAGFVYIAFTVLSLSAWSRASAARAAALARLHAEAAGEAVEEEEDEGPVDIDALGGGKQRR